MRHEDVRANGVRLHVARTGEGPPLVLLHGWPEFWLTWEPVMTRLSKEFSLIAPDLRGFGASEKPDSGPSDRAGPEVHAADILGMLDALGIERAGIVAHDVGAYVGQVLGRTVPERLTGLFFFDCPYPGIGPRLAQPEMLAEIWYQSFHLQPFAAPVVGATRESCRAYIGHFLRHWAGGDPHAFDDVLEVFTDNFLAPGNLQGGFDWYLSQQAGRLAMLKGEAPDLPPITVPTGIRWGTQDPLFPYAWTDRLGETFSNLDLAPFEGAGHFPHRERPDAAARAIAGFFGRITG
ncbi:alpha/beta hydrolase [Methylobacterium sp. Leaf456]|uniref:alpha/beta fold hydrolase n=1 Tax=Methylobacterium sp. Leaf456 TaxID=1736382 RepID=UPI0006F232C4|nr:alpha/beta hydrolase [Methylobacterium sp. Leaf456]KQT58260.1 alpha/beta hydrolase [Methylobacterium sp. Leaf456]